jgi:hypothetical protein
MWMFIGILSLLATIVFAIMGFIGLIKKNGKAKKSFLIMVGTFVLFVAAVSFDDSEPTQEEATNVENNENQVAQDNTNEENEEDQAKKEAEEAEKAKEEEREREEAAKKEEEEAKQAREAALKKAEAMKLSGNGDKVSDVITFEPGFVVFEADYKGASNFIVQLLDENGNMEELLVNEIGTFHGRNAVYLPAGGNYIVQVESEGSWTISPSQVPPDEKDIVKTPGKIEGKGADIAWVYMEEGLRRFTMEHSGESNFIVLANEQALLANEIGNYSGEKAQNVEDSGVYLLDIEADGTWSIDIK